MGLFDLASAIVRLKLDTSAFDSQLEKVNAKIQHSTSMIAGISPIASVALGAGVAGLASVVAGMGSSIRVAGDLEAQYAQLQRVSGLTADETKRLADNLKQLAATKPGISLTEINKVAEFSARQGLGGDDPKKKIEEITKVTNALSDLKLVITDMNVEESATQMLRALNVFKKSPDDIQSFASALVAVDNSSTATAPELLGMIQRMSGAGSVAGASIPHLLALAAAARDMGAEGDVAATALDKLMGKLQAHTEEFAAEVGLNGKALKYAMAKDPVEGIQMFLRALTSMNGEAQFHALENLKMEGRLTGVTLQQIAAGMDKATKYMKIADQEWKTHAALEEGVAIHSKTVWAQWSLLGNQTTLLADKIGGALLPVFGAFIKATTSSLAAVNAFMEGSTTATQAWSSTSVAQVQWASAVFQRFGHSVGAMSSAVRPIMAALSGIFKEHIGGIVLAARDFASSVTASFQSAGASFSWLSAAFAPITDNFRAFMDLVVGAGVSAETLGLQWRIVGTHVGASMQIMYEYAKGYAARVIAKWTDTFTNLKDYALWFADVLGTVFANIQTMAGNLGDIIFTSFSRTFAAIGEMLAFTLSQVKDFVQNPLKFMLDVGNGMVGGWFGEDFQKAMGKAKDKFALGGVGMPGVMDNMAALPDRPADEKLLNSEAEVVAMIQDLVAATKEKRDDDIARLTQAIVNAQEKINKQKEEAKPGAAAAAAKPGAMGAGGGAGRAGESKFELFGIEELQARVQKSIFEQPKDAAREKEIADRNAQAEKERTDRDAKHKEFLKVQEEARKKIQDVVDAQRETNRLQKAALDALTNPRFAPL